MSTQDNLAAALRSLRLKFTSGNDVPVPEARITRAEGEALEQAHAAEAAQAQAAEPVAWRCTWARTQWSQYHDECDPLPEKWDDDPPDQILPLYTHPQPAQDAKDAARYRHMIETSPFMCFGASEYHKKSDLDEAIDNSIAAMAKESGR